VTFSRSLIGDDDALLNFKVVSSRQLEGNSFTGVVDRMTNTGEAPGVVGARTIDTMPRGPIEGQMAAAGALVQGGTFVAEAANLAELTLVLWAPNGTIGRVVVLATIGGVPAGPPLWQGPDIQWPLGLPLRADGQLELTYQPNIPLVPGDTYFVGIDFGLFGEGVPDQIFFVAAAFSDPIPVGQAWGYIDGTGWITLGPAGTDIAARIVMGP
jgi:hypothetical protein